MATPSKGPRRRADDEVDEKRFPNLAAEKAWDREQHIRKGMAAGLSRKEATRHADEEVRED